MIDLERQLQEHHKYPPEKGSKHRIIQDYTEKEAYLEHEVGHCELWVVDVTACLPVRVVYYLILHFSPLIVMGFMGQIEISFYSLLKKVWARLYIVFSESHRNACKGVNSVQCFEISFLFYFSAEALPNLCLSAAIQDGRFSRTGAVPGGNLHRRG